MEQIARHPLQRLASPSRRVSLLLHTAGIASFLSSFRFLAQWETEIAAAFGGHFQFLTIIGLSLALFTFVVGLAADLTLSPALFQAKNLFAVCSAPLEVLITILFWGLCAIDKSLVFPPESELTLIPNLGFHAAPGLFLALDLLLLSPPWTIDGFVAVALSQTIAFLYWFWVEYCYRQNGWYPYPIFALLNTWQRAALFTFSAFLMTGSTMLLKWLHGKVNGVLTAGVRAKTE
ncbi:FAR-17a/AIG1-like protein [Xylaria bambusicola]|uniref:FAR-17a/AIG1-like protein n=1 Tax=Xylaria bambusicola TaxID=326684 RepID=UPI002007DED3|nr:FAR-17a/AIG1-like protein [Xylaria bambusicola]KAI0526066.1 FAR-17a/AIG1-like protein [Xylaria bambusicola]